MSFFNELKRRNVLRFTAAYSVTAWLIIQVVDTVFPSFGFGEAAVRFVTIVSAIGLVPAAIFAWVFELTPDGLKREKDVDRTRSLTPQTGKQLDRMIMIILALALGYFAFDKFVLSEFREAHIAESARQEGRGAALVESYGDKSIAVLPFVNMSDDASNEYFSDGISEELLNLLAKIPELRVISRSSAFSFKGKNLEIPEIAKRLNVAHILEGSVRKAGNQVRITAQLIDARADTHLWSETYDRNLTDIFAIQDEITLAIGDALKVRLLQYDATGAQPPPRDVVVPEAYEAFLAGRQLTHKRGKKNLEAALQHVQRSLELDNDYAPAHAQFAIVIILLKHGPGTYGDLTLTEVLERALPHIERALALDPQLAEVFGAKSLLAYNSDDYEAGIINATRALELNASYVDALNWLYLNNFAYGKYKEAYESLERLLQVDPLSMVGRVNYSTFLGHRGRIDAAHAMAESIADQNVSMSYRTHALVAIYVEGELAASTEWLLKAHAIAPEDNAVNKDLAWGLSNLDLPGEALRLGQDLQYETYLGQAMWPEAIAVARERAARDPEDGTSALELANALHLSGDVTAAQAVYEQLLAQANGQPIFDQYFSTVLPTTRAAFGRLSIGDLEGANTLLELAVEDNRQRAKSGKRDTYYFRTAALIAAVEGNRSIMLHNIEQAIEAGMRERIALLEPAFRPFRDDLEFKALENKLATLMIDEKLKFLQITCIQNPVVESWQPLPGTCTQAQ